MVELVNENIKRAKKVIDKYTNSDKYNNLTQGEQVAVRCINSSDTDIVDIDNTGLYDEKDVKDFINFFKKCGIRQVRFKVSFNLSDAVDKAYMYMTYILAIYDFVSCGCTILGAERQGATYYFSIRLK